MICIFNFVPGRKVGRPSYLFHIFCQNLILSYQIYFNGNISKLLFLKSFFLVIFSPKKKSIFFSHYIEDFVSDSVVATGASPRKLGNVALVASRLGEK